MTVAMGFFPQLFFRSLLLRVLTPKIEYFQNFFFLDEIPRMIDVSVYTFKIYLISWLLGVLGVIHYFSYILKITIVPP